MGEIVKDNTYYKKQEDTILKNDINSGFTMPGEAIAKHIGQGIYAVGSIKNIWYFTKANNETIFSLKPVKETHYFKKASYLAGFKEIKDVNGIYNLYPLKNIDAKTGNPISGSKPLDKYSMGYFNAWNDIVFHEDKLGLETFKRPSIEGNLHKPQAGQLEGYIWSGTLRIKDLYTFLKQKQIDKKTFDKHLPSIQKLLLIQIGDTRFEALGDYVTEQEIKDYYEGGYISKDLARECYKKIKERDSTKQKKDNKKKEIHSETRINASEIVVV